MHIVKRTLGVVNASLNNMEISVGGSKTSMTQKTLQIEYITTSFQYVRSKTMSQSMNGAWLSDSRLSLVFFELVFYPRIIEITLIPSAREQIMFWTGWLKNSPIPS